LGFSVFEISFVATYTGNGDDAFTPDVVISTGGDSGGDASSSSSDVLAPEVTIDDPDGEPTNDIAP